jgi:hypothetical protein
MERNLLDERCKTIPENFDLMMSGQIVTDLGSSLLRFALSLYVLDVTGRADLFAMLFAISVLAKRMMKNEENM